MRKRTAAVAAAIVGVLMSMLAIAQPAHAATGFHVSNGRLLEGNGNDFIMRGVSHAHTWFPSETTAALAGIKAKGANTVRVVLATGGQWAKNDTADVANVVAQCKQNRLICVLEAHDTTGFGEQGAAVSLDKAADYWISVKSALQGQENNVIINIGNEPYGNNNATGWTADTKAAIQKLRGADFQHTLMVDAPNWGQDWQFVMRDNAASVEAADTAHNTVFSIHMYGVFDTAAEVSDYLNRFVSARLPIVVGEFGFNHSDGNPDEDAIMATAQSLRLGYLGWSWSGNGGGVEYLDMVTNFNPNALTSWGERIFNGANGIKSTAKEATVYGGGSADTTPPSTPGTPTASNVTSSGVTLSWAPSTDAGGVSGYDVVRVSGTGETTAATATGSTVTVTGLNPSTAYTFAVYARDTVNNRSARSGTVAVTTSAGSPGGGACSVVYQVTNQWPGGFQGDIVIRNSGTSAINNWTLGWTFANGQTITNMWGGVPQQTGGSVTVTPQSHTASIPAAGFVDVGFTGTWNGGNTNPTAFTLSGATCSLGTA